MGRKQRKEDAWRMFEATGHPRYFNLYNEYLELERENKSKKKK